MPINPSAGTRFSLYCKLTKRRLPRPRNIRKRRKLADFDFRNIEMALLEIVTYPNPVLETPGEPVTVFDEKLKKLVADMFETMDAASGVGLAAPQVGVSRRLFVMDCSGGRDPEQRVALINPEVLTVEGDQTGDEGCLSFPGVFFPVKRSLRAVVRAQDVTGETFELDGMDLTARCMLHETDHCDGIVFIDHTTVLKREMVKRKMRRLAKMAKM
jgi:peptide deformylase